jgi:type II restriction enzyme
MIERLSAPRPPNLILMRYDAAERSVRDVLVVPTQFFRPALIEPRKPLVATARRAGWQGCNILIGDLPEAGRIWLIRDREPLSREHVLETWRRSLFLREAQAGARGWLIEVMKAVERRRRSGG